MSGSLLRALVAVAVAATVGLAVASGSPSRTLDDRNWEGRWSRDGGRRSFYVFLQRDVAGPDDVAGQGPLSFSFLYLERRCGGTARVSSVDQGDGGPTVRVAPNGAFSYAGAVDPYSPKVKLSFSGRIAGREIPSTVRIAGSLSVKRRPCSIDSGTQRFVARCVANCPPAPPRPPPAPSRLTTLVVPYRSIAGIALGMTRRQVLHVFGDCDGGACTIEWRRGDTGSTRSGGTDRLWRYWYSAQDEFRSISAYFRRGRVVEIGANQGDVKLASGVGMGSPFAAMRAAFPPKRVRCDGPVCYAQRIGPGWTWAPRYIRGDPVRTRTPNVFLTEFAAASRRGRVVEITVMKCLPFYVWARWPLEICGILTR